MMPPCASAEGVAYGRRAPRRELVDGLVLLARRPRRRKGHASFHGEHLIPPAARRAGKLCAGEVVGEITASRGRLHLSEPYRRRNFLQINGSSGCHLCGRLLSCRKNRPHSRGHVSFLGRGGWASVHRALAKAVDRLARVRWLSVRPEHLARELRRTPSRGLARRHSAHRRDGQLPGGPPNE
jgi:hypothetical protein